MATRSPAAALILFVVYDHPSDYPEGFLIRRWFGFHPEKEPFATGATVEEGRAHIPAGLYNLGREADDDPAILEVWV